MGSCSGVPDSRRDLFWRRPSPVVALLAQLLFEVTQSHAVGLHHAPVRNFLAAEEVRDHQLRRRRQQQRRRRRQRRRHRQQHRLDSAEPVAWLLWLFPPACGKMRSLGCCPQLTETKDDTSPGPPGPIVWIGASRKTSSRVHHRAKPQYLSLFIVSLC